MMNLVQGDCKCGALAFVAGENLSAATGLLVRLSSAGKAVKPGAVSDIVPYVVACGAFEGYLCGVVPLSSAANCRVVLKGACQVGSLLVSVGDGRVEAGTLSGSAVPVGIAEETGVEGQRVLLRPVAVGARGADGAPGVPGAAGAAGAGGGVLTVPYASLVGDKPAIAGSAGLVVWLAFEDGYGWSTQWNSWSGHFVQGVVVGHDAGAGTVSVMVAAEATEGSASGLGVYPRSIPAACVRSGAAVAGAHLGAVGSAGHYVLAAAAGTETFAGCCYATVMSVDGEWLTCGWGGAVPFGG